ncbi:MAG TPA: acyl-CoA dehydrogenase family protein, partial [Longimicrobiaceae bacterium]|nr:acyl-CoA dehydrogenase family protein [Longimicrobiaceae bacterium]
ALAGAYLADDAVAAIFGEDRTPIIAGQYAPRHEATPTSDGYAISGRWSFASGSRYASWFMCGFRVSGAQGSAGPPEVRMAFLPRGEVELVDNWQVIGLQGTASCDYLVPGAVVPRGFTFDQRDLQPGRGGAAYRMPSLGTLFVPFHAGMALGTARRALNEITRLAAEKRRSVGPSVAERGAFQQRLGRTEAQLRAARLFVFDAVEEIWRAVSAGDRPSLEQRAMARLAAAHATDVAAAAITTAYRFAAGTAIYLSNPLQRCLRDIHTVTQHIAVADEIYEMAAQVLLGVDSKQHAFV